MSELKASTDGKILVDITLILSFVLGRVKIIVGEVELKQYWLVLHAAFNSISVILRWWLTLFMSFLGFASTRLVLWRVLLKGTFHEKTSKGSWGKFIAKVIKKLKVVFRKAEYFVHDVVNGEDAWL